MKIVSQERYCNPGTGEWLETGVLAFTDPEDAKPMAVWALIDEQSEVVMGTGSLEDLLKYLRETLEKSGWHKIDDTPEESEPEGRVMVDPTADIPFPEVEILRPNTKLLDEASKRFFG